MLEIMENKEINCRVKWTDDVEIAGHKFNYAIWGYGEVQNTLKEGDSRRVGADMYERFIPLSFIVEKKDGELYIIKILIS
jgi:hypothetical protein